MNIRARFNYRRHQLNYAVHKELDRLSGIFNGVADDRLSNGPRLQMKSDFSKSVVSFKIVILSGSNHDPFGKEGMAHLTEHATAEDIKNERSEIGEFKQKGGNFSAFITLEETGYVFEKVVSGKGGIEKLLRLARNMIFHGSFDPDQLEKEKTIIAQEIAMREEYADMGRMVRKKACSISDDVEPILGSAETLKNITVADLEHFHGLHYIPANARIEISGPVTNHEMRQMLNAAFGDLPCLEPVAAPEFFYKGGYKHAESKTAENVTLGTAFAYPKANSRFSLARDYILEKYLINALGNKLRPQSDPVSYDMSVDINRGLLTIIAGANQKHSARLQPAVIDILTNIAQGKIDAAMFEESVAAYMLFISKMRDGAFDNFTSPYARKNMFKEQQISCKNIRPEDLAEIMQQVLRSSEPTVVIRGNNDNLMPPETYMSALKAIAGNEAAPAITRPQPN